MKREKARRLLLVFLLVCVFGAEPVHAASNEFTRNIDNNSFNHNKKAFFNGDRNYKIHDIRVLKALYKYADPGEVVNVTARQYVKWGGSCYGVSTLMALVKNGKLKCWQITSKPWNETFYCLPEPRKDLVFRDNIQFYQLSFLVNKCKFKTSAYLDSSSYFSLRSSFIRELVECAKTCSKEGKAAVFGYGYSYTKYNKKTGEKKQIAVNHAILCVGWIEEKQLVKFYDLNYPEGYKYMKVDLEKNEFSFRATKKMTIGYYDKKQHYYKYFRIWWPDVLNKPYESESKNINNNNSKANVFATARQSANIETDWAYEEDTYDLDFEESLDYEDEDSMSEEEFYPDEESDGLNYAPYDDEKKYTDSVYIMTNSNSDFTITTESGQTLIVKNGGVGGTIPIRGIDHIYNDEDNTDIIIETADFEAADVDYDTEVLDLCIYNNEEYRWVEGEGIDDISLNKDWDLEMSGDSYSFDVISDSFDANDSSDPVLANVSATANGTVKVESEPGLLTVTSDTKMKDIECSAFNAVDSVDQKVSDTTTVSVDTSSIQFSSDANSSSNRTSMTATHRNFISVRKLNHRDDQISLSWNAIPGAEGYDIFASFGNEKLPSKPTKTVNGTKAVITKAYRKTGYSKVSGGLIRYTIKAYKTVGGQKKYFAKSKINQTVGKNNSGYSDAKKVTTKKESYALNVGKSAQIKASVKTVTGKNQLPRTSSIRYTSSDKSVATVTKSGKIRAHNAGACYIYVTAVNGLTKNVMVRVK